MRLRTSSTRPSRRFCPAGLAYAPIPDRSSAGDRPGRQQRLAGLKSGWLSSHALPKQANDGENGTETQQLSRFQLIRAAVSHTAGRLSSRRDSARQASRHRWGSAGNIGRAREGVEHDRTGIPVLINTSFNVHEQPIVNRPEGCRQVLLDGRVDLVTTQAAYERV